LIPESGTWFEYSELIPYFLFFRERLTNSTTKHNRTTRISNVPPAAAATTIWIGMSPPSSLLTGSSLSGKQNIGIKSC